MVYARRAVSAVRIAEAASESARVAVANRSVTMPTGSFLCSFESGHTARFTGLSKMSPGTIHRYAR